MAVTKLKIASTPTGEGDPKPKAKVKVPAKKPFDFGEEMKAGYKTKLKYDNNAPLNEVLLAAAKEGKIDPSELMTSAWVEGMNKAAADPDSVSEAYNAAAAKDPTINQFPVDGFHNYGVDTFGNNYEALKKYLPAGFEQRFKLYDAVNEQKSPIKTAAFKTNRDALVAKAAFMNMEKDNIKNYAKKHGVELDDKAQKYFTMAAFNGGPGRARQMVDEYVKAKDKNAYIDKGQTQYGQIHKNISPRMKMLEMAKGLLNPVPTPSPIPMSQPSSIAPLL
jgi:hypothetical protein